MNPDHDAPSPAAFDVVAALVTLLADPAATKSRIEVFSKRIARAEEAQAKAAVALEAARAEHAAADAAMAAREQALREREVALAGREGMVRVGEEHIARWRRQHDFQDPRPRQLAVQPGRLLRARQPLLATAQRAALVGWSDERRKRLEAVIRQLPCKCHEFIEDRSIGP
jgi:hypothetical protein